MGGIQLVDAVLDGHFLRRWRRWRVIEARAVQRERLGMGGERKVGHLPLQEGQAFGTGQSSNFFFRKATWVVKRPISAYNSWSCSSWAASFTTKASRFSKAAGRALRAI